jgi:hypothetical protein
MYDPINSKPTKYFCFIGGVPKNIVVAINSIAAGGGTKDQHNILKTWYGASYKTKLLFVKPPIKGGGLDDDISFEDIETFLVSEEPPATREQEYRSIPVRGPVTVEYITDIEIYPEDTFDELKDKIHVASGVPQYRQHLFYEDRGRINTTYNLFANGVYDVNMFELHNYKDYIGGAPIDKQLYNKREFIRIEARDEFAILGESIALNKTIFVTDLAIFSMSSIASSAGDTYQLDLYYYGFIVKYWPQFTKDVFREYLNSESELADRYPDLAKSRIALKSRFAAETKISSVVYKCEVKAAKWAEKNINIAITQMLAYVENSNAFSVNVRNLFDLVMTSNCVPEIHAYVSAGTKKYKLIKKHMSVANGEIVFPPNAVMKSGFTAAIGLGNNKYMFMNISPQGRVHIRSTWGEEDEHGFQDIIKLMKKYCNPLLADINKMGRAVMPHGSQLPIIGTQNMKYLSLNICLMWKKIITESVFRTIRKAWEPYLVAGITAPRNVQQMDAYEFYFCKGMYQFDTTKIEKIIATSNNIVLFNQYAHLSDSAVKQKWEQNYTGRIVKMFHRTTDVKFEVSDIHEVEFELFRRYVVSFVLQVIQDEQLNTVAKSASASVEASAVTKRLRKLREQDPELFNLKKYGSPKVYSTICQNQHQPLIYTPDEIKNMNKKDIAKLTKYWNFTTNKEAYYSCPNKKFPHLSFKVGHHPKNYCLPCCKKIESSENSKKTKINNTCLKEHIYKIGTKDTSTSRHVVLYKKELDIDRLSKLPNKDIHTLLRNSVDVLGSDFYMYGVAQHLPGAPNAGFIYALVAASDAAGEISNMNIFIKGLLEKMRDRGGVAEHIIFNTLMNGHVQEMFKSYAELMNIISDIFLYRKHTINHTGFDWSRLFMELVYKFLNIVTYIFVDEDGTGENVYLKLADFGEHDSNNRNIIIVKRRGQYYPVFLIDVNKFFRTGEIELTHFHDKSKVIGTLKDIIKSGRAATQTKTITVRGLIDGQKQGEYEIAKLYINKNNLCYAAHVIMKEINSTCYVPVEYGTYPQGFDLDFAGPKSRTTLMSSAASMIKKFGLDIVEYIVLRDTNKIIGVMVKGGLIFYVVDTDVGGLGDKITMTTTQYDYNKINSLILDRAPPKSDGRISKLGNSLYDVYMYRLFIFELMSYLDKEKNIVIRNHIIELVKATNFRESIRDFNARLQKVLELHKQDYSIIQSHLSVFYNTHFNKAMLIAAIEETKYDFDNITINRLRGLPVPEIVSELEKICTNIVVDEETIPHIVHFPNIYATSCAEDKGGANRKDYCTETGKLIVRDLKGMLEILAGDIKSDIRVRYLTDVTFESSVVDFMRMEKHPNETITIQILDPV